MTTRPRPESERSLHGPSQSFDLGAEVIRSVEALGDAVCLLNVATGSDETGTRLDGRFR
jgi:hypothetical protein